MTRKTRIAVPTARNFRATAVQAVDALKKATGMFDASTIGFAQEMIADTHNHRAQTVGELLAFMRKYRLLFASADKRPEDVEQYLQLYRLLRQQKDVFGEKVTGLPPESTIAGDWIPLFNGRVLAGWSAFQYGRPVPLGHQHRCRSRRTELQGRRRTDGWRRRRSTRASPSSSSISSPREARWPSWALELP